MGVSRFRSFPPSSALHGCSCRVRRTERQCVRMQNFRPKTHRTPDFTGVDALSPLEKYGETAENSCALCAGSFYARRVTYVRRRRRHTRQHAQTAHAHTQAHANAHERTRTARQARQAWRILGATTGYATHRARTAPSVRRSPRRQTRRSPHSHYAHAVRATPRGATRQPRRTENRTGALARSLRVRCIRVVSNVSRLLRR
jgi:hypothetical protein